LGPNLYAKFPVIRLVLDLGALEQWPTARLGHEFQKRLLEHLPGLAEHGCSYGEPGGFVRRMREDEGTWLGHVLEHVAIELQNVAGTPVTFGKTRTTGVAGQYEVVYEYDQAEVGTEASRLAMALLSSLLPEELRTPGLMPAGFDFAEERDAYIRFAQRRALGPSTASLVKAAERREIPWIRLNEYSLVQLGHGKLQKRLQATVTSETRHIAVEIASDKEETNRLLGDLGLPVPKQKLVTSEEGRGARRRFDRLPGRRQAVQREPRAGCRDRHGRRGPGPRGLPSARVGIRAVSSSRASSRARSPDARRQNGDLIAVSKGGPGHVVGDGKHTIEELVDLVNADPRRGIGHEKVLTRLEFDAQAERLLARRGSNGRRSRPKV
jgi:cyanophycin synthetase